MAKAAPPLEIAERGTRRRGRSRRWQFALAGLVLLAGAAAAVAILSTSATAALHVLPNSLVELNPHTGKPMVVQPVGSLPGPIAITPTAIWTANYGSDDVSRYDLRTHTVQTRGLTPGQPNDIKFDREGNAWISNIKANDQPAKLSVITRVEAGVGGTSPGEIGPSHTQPIRVPLPFAGLEALGGDHLWVIVGFHGPTNGDNRVAVIHVPDGQVSAVLHLDESATSVAYGYDTAWIGTYGSGGFGSLRYDKLKYDSRIEAFRAGQSKPKDIVLAKHGAKWGPTSIAVGHGAVWALTCCGPGNQLLKINPITLRIARRLDLSGMAPDAVAVGAGGVWLLSDHSVSTINPETDKIIRTFPLVSGGAGQLCGIAATRRQLWVTSGHIYCDTIGG